MREARVLHIDHAAELIEVAVEDLEEWIDEGIVETAFPNWAYANEGRGLPSIRSLVSLRYSSPLDDGGPLVARARQVGLGAVDIQEIREALDALGGVDLDDTDNPGPPNGAPMDLADTNWWASKALPGTRQ